MATEHTSVFAKATPDKEDTEKKVEQVSR